MEETDIWLSFELFKNWEYYNGYAYDEISDDDITFVLKDPHQRQIVDNFNLKRGWQSELYEGKEETHVHRIAKLTQVIGIYGINSQDFINIYVSFYGKVFGNIYSRVFNCPSLICDGHHRIRALQYLGYDSFPVILSGYHDDETKFIEKYCFQHPTIIKKY